MRPGVSWAAWGHQTWELLGTQGTSPHCHPAMMNNIVPNRAAPETAQQGPLSISQEKRDESHQAESHTQQSA